MIEKTERANMLYDFYGQLLREKQRAYVESYYVDDLSLSEIAEQEGISRQAVHDHLRRAMTQLERYETLLHLVVDYRERLEACSLIREALQSVLIGIETRNVIDEQLRRIVEEG